MRLNTNENPHPPSQALVAELPSASACSPRTLNRYPDRDARALRADLAGVFVRRARASRSSPEQIWAANGSNEVIQQLLQLVGGAGRTALGFEPSYSMHRRIAEATGTPYVPGSRDDDFTIDVDRAVADGPRGPARHRAAGLAEQPDRYRAPARDDRRDLRRRRGRRPSMVVVDEAYAEFARPGTPSAVTLLAGRPSLVVTRTLSKAFAMAGLRLGYLAADPAVVRGRAAGPPAVPPVLVDAGRRSGGARATPTTCWPRSVR